MGPGGSWASHMMPYEHGWVVQATPVTLPDMLCSSARSSPWVKFPRGAIGVFGFVVVVVVLKDWAERGPGTSTVCCCPETAAPGLPHDRP